MTCHEVSYYHFRQPALSCAVRYLRLFGCAPSSTWALLRYVHTYYQLLILSPLSLIRAFFGSQIDTPDHMSLQCWCCDNVPLRFKFPSKALLVHVMLSMINRNDTDSQAHISQYHKHLRISLC
jgi:hypothetical protein